MVVKNDSKFSFQDPFLDPLMVHERPGGQLHQQVLPKWPKLVGFYPGPKICLVQCELGPLRGLFVLHHTGGNVQPKLGISQRNFRWNRAVLLGFRFFPPARSFRLCTGDLSPEVSGRTGVCTRSYRQNVGAKLCSVGNSI